MTPRDEVSAVEEAYKFRLGNIIAVAYCNVVSKTHGPDCTKVRRVSADAVKLRHPCFGTCTHALVHKLIFIDICLFISNNRTEMGTSAVSHIYTNVVAMNAIRHLRSPPSGFLSYLGASVAVVGNARGKFGQKKPMRVALLHLVAAISSALAESEGGVGILARNTPMAAPT